MDNFEIDLDEEAISLDGEWRTREDLATEIKGKLEAGDYQIAQLSQAIEILNQSLSQMQSVNLRLSGEVAEALEAAAQEIGRTPSSIIRQLVEDYLFPKDDVLEAEASSDESVNGEEEIAGEEVAMDGEEAALDKDAAEEEIGDVLDEPAESPEDEPASDPTPTTAEE